MGYYKGQSSIERVSIIMKFLHEKLYFYYIALKTEFVSFETYKIWLNRVFLDSNSSDDVFLELQFCTHSLEETIKKLYIYLYDKVNSIDYHVVMKMIITELKMQYDNETALCEITRKLYNIWRLLPIEVSSEKPFLILNSIDDPWSWKGREDIIEIIDNLLNYYDSTDEK